MRFDVLTLFPEFITSATDFSIIKRAKEEGVISVNAVNPRDYSADKKHRRVDDTPYGGGFGMVLAPQPYIDAYESIGKIANSVTLMMTPQGTPLTDKLTSDLAKYEQIIILCGHYEGFDERIREIIKPTEISIGDFVLTGGELPALCVIDSVSRKLEGTLGKIESADEESFSNGLLEYPQYTKPREYRGLQVPEILLNGNHKLIKEFQLQEQIKRTKKRRPDLYRKWKKSQTN